MTGERCFPVPTASSRSSYTNCRCQKKKLQLERGRPKLPPSPPSCSFNSSGAPSIPLRPFDLKAVKARPFLRFLSGERCPETKLWGLLIGLADSSHLRFLTASTELSADGGWCEFVYLTASSAADSNVAEASAATRNAFCIVETKLAF